MPGQRLFVGFQKRTRAAVFAHRQRGLGAFSEGGHLLKNAVLVDAEIGGLQSVHIVTFAVGHLELSTTMSTLTRKMGRCPSCAL